MGDLTRCYVAIRICEAESLEQIDISLVVLPVISLDAYEHGAFGLSMEITVFFSSRYNLAGDLRIGPQVQVRELLRSVDHQKSSGTNNKMNRILYV